MAVRIVVGLVMLAGCGWLAVEILAAPKPTESVKESASDPVTEHERKFMAALHRNTVEVFIDRPGFGIRRLHQPFTDVISAPKPLESNDQGSIPQQEQPKIVAKKPAKDKDSHYSFQEAIKQQRGGYPASETEVWTVQKVQLVGLTKNPKPVVYDSADVPGMKGIKDIKTREPDAFEKGALEVLKSGENLKIEKHGKDLRVMGPIYAGKQCLACHDQAGELLGAFTYVLELQPVMKAK